MGTIPDRCGFQTSPAVHPHGRGDNNRYADRMYGAYGSPPRAWGQCSSSFEKGWEWRFTPTGVGTIAPGRGEDADRAVHPHGRGDNVEQFGLRLKPHGSPPRAWGQFYQLPDAGGRARFTPTGVGTISLIESRAGTNPVHPHGRGDNDPTCERMQRIRRFTPTGVGTILASQAF